MNPEPEKAPLTVETVERLEAELGMVMVPAAEFALLFHYSHVGQLDVPAHLRRHPDWPGRMHGTGGHRIVQALRPYAERAAKSLLSPAPPPPTGDQ